MECKAVRINCSPKAILLNSIHRNAAEEAAEDVHVETSSAVSGFQEKHIVLPIVFALKEKP